MRKISQLFFLLVVSFFASVSVAKPVNVVATTGMIADLAINIGQDKVKVISLMSSGVDPHLYKATQGDLRRLQKADIIFYNGLHLEGKMQDIFNKLAKKKPVFAVTKQIDHAQLIKADGAHDPHLWFDVSLWHAAAKEVLARLVEVDSINKDFYQKNAKAYLAKLEQLHVWAGEQIGLIPKSQRMLITAHDAFGYFGRAYGLEVHGLQGVSTASEFGLNDIKVLKRMIVKRKIKAVFVESSVPKKFLQSLVSGVKAEGGDLKIGGELFSDAMGLKGTEEGTYIGMVKHNVNTIVSALK
jgi:manganese/zinc/iron transport system substrate-binding protein